MPSLPLRLTVAIVVLAALALAAFGLRDRLADFFLGADRTLGRLQEIETMEDPALLALACDRAAPAAERREALKYLRRHGGAGTAPRLAEALAAETDGGLQNSLIMSIGYEHDPAGAPALLPFFLHESRDFRNASSFAMARIFGEKLGRGAVEEIEKLAPLLGGGNPFEPSRLKASEEFLSRESSGLSAWKAAMPADRREVVLALLGGRKDAVPAAAVEDRDLPALKRLLSNPDFGERAAAARALGKFESSDPHFTTVTLQDGQILTRLRLLMPLMEDSSARVREAALEGIGSLAGKLPSVSREYHAEKLLARRRVTAPLAHALDAFARRAERPDEAHLAREAAKTLRR